MLAAEAISITGNRLAMIAIPWFVLETTGDPARAGLTGVAYFLPVVLGGVLGGALVDRFGFVRSSVAADVASGLTVAAIPLLHQVDQLSFGWMLVLTFVGSLLDVPGTTARRALLPGLATQAAVRLERVMSAHETVIRVAQLAGGLLGGALILAVGAVGVLVVDAASFLVSALLVGLIARRALPVAPRSAGRRRYLADIHEGLAFIRADSLLPGLLVLFMVANMVDNALFAVLLPTVAEQVLDDPLALGLSIAAFGAGALVGAVSFGVFGHRLPRRTVLATALVVSGAPKFVVLAFVPSVPALVAVMAVAGVAAGPVNPLLTSAQFSRVPPELRGRVSGTIMSAVVTAVPLGAFGAGLLVSHLGLTPTLVLAAALYLLISAYPAVGPAWRHLDAPPARPASAPPPGAGA
ncbi:MFS transporter [Micromonospora sp. NPDC049051]|uniref:MFS transporter n=1 Tax=Micromonospora sp. NPDC049051 TaxID=3364264 RepID=UPI0037189262